MKLMTQRLKEVDAWARSERAVVGLLPALLTAAVEPQKEDETLIKGKDLASELTRLYRDVVSEYFGGDRRKVVGSQLTRYRTAETTPRMPLPLLILIWLSERMDEGEFHDDSQVNLLLSLFNPVAAAKAKLLADEPLPSFDKASPANPLLRSSLNRDIDQAERNLSESIATLIGLRQLSSASLGADFFPNGGDQATFLVYRREVQSSGLAKGFLVIEPWRARASDAYTFNYYHKTTGKDLRETRGFILTFRSTHYFLGATGQSNATAGRSKHRPVLGEALKCIAVHRDFGLASKAVWSGMFMSHCQKFNPIAGRCILVRARFETWQQADIGVLKLNDLETDLEASADVELIRSWEPSALAAMIQIATDNSYEPPDSIVSHEELAGPLSLVDLVEAEQDAGPETGRL